MTNETNKTNEPRRHRKLITGVIGHHSHYIETRDYIAHLRHQGVEYSDIQTERHDRGTLVTFTTTPDA